MASDEPDQGRTRPVARAASGPRLAVTVVDRVGRRVQGHGVGPWLARTMSRTKGRVTIALVSDAHMRRLNREYRRADYATDVLSFPAESESAPAPRSPRFLGDVVIATGVAARQARDHGHSLRTELRVLALHGLLHLLGYDHETDTGQMAAAERRILRRGLGAAGLIVRQPSP